VRIIEPILRCDLYSFIHKSFYALNPGVKYLPNYHIWEIAKALEGVTQGKISRLIINVPPRYLKSHCVNVAWPAWLLGNNPARKIISASYNGLLAVKHSVDCRFIMQSEWYEEIFPDLQFAKDQNEKNKFMTTERGFRMATSVNGGITGEGGDFLIIDDPINPAMAASKTARDDVVEWFDQTFSTRLNNKKKGAIVLVMQRLHEDDLSGILLRRNGWKHLCLPAISAKGELLHEAREGLKEIEMIKSDLGEYGFAAQYMQNPYKLENGLIDKDWLQFYDKLPEENKGVYQSWDTAIKTGNNADYSAGICFIECENKFYVADVVRGKFEYPELKRRIVDFAEKWKADAVLIEDKASGQSIIQDLKAETKLPILAQMPKADKITRLAAITPMIEAGKLCVPKYAEWYQQFEAEILSFPESVNDDQVDALSQFLTWVKWRGQQFVSLRRV